MRRGELVPDEMVLQILRLELDRVAVEGRAVLLDGYPRTVAQARELDRYLQIHAVVSLDIPHEVYFHFAIPDVHDDDDDDDVDAYRCRIESSPSSSRLCCVAWHSSSNIEQL